MGLIVVLVSVAFLAPHVLQIVTPTQLHSMQSFTEIIWWPATLTRGVLYGVLGAFVYPAWIDRQRQATLANLDRLPVAGLHAHADTIRTQIETRLSVLAQARQRGHWVFLGLVGCELVFAQGPYYLLKF